LIIIIAAASGGSSDARPELGVLGFAQNIAFAPKFEAVENFKKALWMPPSIEPSKLYIGHVSTDKPFYKQGE